MLVVMSGLPGTGKSAVADAIGRALRAPVLAVDPIDAAMRRSGIDADQPTGLAAYVVADALARRMLGLGLTVVVDAVNAVPAARAQWESIGGDLDVPVRIIEVTCSDPDLHRRRLAARSRDLPGFPEPTWDDVLATRAEFQPWAVERLVLDSVDDLDSNVAQALAYLVPGDGGVSLRRLPAEVGGPQACARPGGRARP